MKRVGKFSAAAVIVGTSLLLTPFAGLASAVVPVTQVTGTTSARLLSTGPVSASVGIVIPADAIILKIVVETYDDYDAIGAPASQNRVTANQKQEQVDVEIGGKKIGQKTTDIPEVGPGGNTRAASITTVVFEGERKVDGGVVTVHHGGNKSSPNSLQIRRVIIDFLDVGSGGNYPPKPGGVVIDDDDDEENDDEIEIDEDEEEEEEEDKGKNGTTKAAAEVVASTTSTTTTTTVAPKVDSNAVVPPTVASTTAPTVEPQVKSASITPIVSNASVGSSSAVASSALDNGTLPVTGSDSFDVVQLAGVLAAAGLGLLAVTRIRRRGSILRS